MQYKKEEGTMMVRKFLIAGFLTLLVLGIGALNMGYAMSITDYGRPEPGAANPAAQSTTEGTIGTSDPSRTGDIGFVTEAEHNSIRRFIQQSVRDEKVTTEKEIDGEFGEKIVVQTIKGFRNVDEGRRAAGHFSIRGEMVDGRNVVYVTVDEDEYNKNPKIAQHEVEEYKAIAKEAVKKAELEGQQLSHDQLRTAKEKIVNWLDDANVSAAFKNEFLLGTHRSVPTQLGDTERDIMPDTLAYLQSLKGLRGASGLGEQASNEEIVVIGAKEVISNKTAFDKWLIKEGAKFSVSIIATTQEEYEGVMGYERYRESSVRVKVAAVAFGPWAQQLEPDQRITLSNKEQLDSLLEDLKRNPAGVRLDALKNLNPALSQAIAVGV